MKKATPSKKAPAKLQPIPSNWMKAKIPGVEYKTYKWEFTHKMDGELERSTLKSEQETLNELEWFLKGMLAGKENRQGLDSFIHAVNQAKNRVYQLWLDKSIELKNKKEAAK